MKQKITLWGKYRKESCTKNLEVVGNTVKMSKWQYNDAKKKCCYAGDDYLIAIIDDHVYTRKLDIDDRNY